MSNKHPNYLNDQNDVLTNEMGTWLNWLKLERHFTISCGVQLLKTANIQIIWKVWII